MRTHRSPSLIPILALIIGLVIEPSQSLRFDLQSGHIKCFSEEMNSKSITTGNYHVVNPNDSSPLPDSHKITVRVTLGKNILHYAERVGAGKFGFKAYEMGEYSTCMWLEDPKPPVTVTVEFEWKTGVAAKDWGAVAKRGSVAEMETELKKMMDKIISIHGEMFNSIDRETEMQRLNRSTNSNMFWLSFTSLFVCFSVASLQFWHLKTFFVRKKML